MTLEQQISTSRSIECKVDQDIETGLDFILSHFFKEDPIFPRKISTYKSQINKPYQFPVSSKKEIIESFKDSNFVDCRINAYPLLTEYKGIQRYKPNFIFIDLDKKNYDFKSIIELKLALSNTLKNINRVLGGHPTVLSSGNGYHIIQPVYCRTALENVMQFNEFDKPSEQFLRFTKDYLSNGKADPSNHPSFKSCLLRIPGSINSKNMQQVITVQKWNGFRPQVTKDLLLKFRRHLIQKKINEENQRQKILNMRRRNEIRNSNNSNYNTYNYYYTWIEEKILANSFPDYRKIIVDLILAPYLINIKKMSYQESYQVIREWLDKCNSLKKLDNYSNFVNYRIHYALKTAAKKGIGPMSLNNKIKIDNRYSNNLYLLILQKKGER
jgi:hypothetical protein